MKQCCTSFLHDRREHCRLRGAVLWCGLLVLPLLSGCMSKAERQAQEALSAYYFGDYGRAVELLAPLSEKTDQNFVLNNLRLGSAALAAYDLDTAEAAFLRAYEVLNAVGVNDGGRTLGAVLVDEKLRIWRGEPFERAMANFYLGLIYYMRQDYNNARGAFENALFKLRDYRDDTDPKADEYEVVETNFALGYLMLGKSYQHLGRDDLAEENFSRAVSLRPYLRDLADPALHAQSNLLLVVDFGSSPRKITDFDGAIVGFGPTPAEVGPVPPPRVEVDGRLYPLGGLARPPVDLLALAQDRRWQSIDTIRTVKSAIGTGLIAAGAYMGLKRDPEPEAALAPLAAGLLLKATSQADVRQWEMLPRTVFLLPLRVEPGRHDITVSFPGLRGLEQTWRGLEVPEEGEATYYFHMHRFNPGPFEWPPPALVGVEQGR